LISFVRHNSENKNEEEEEKKQQSSPISCTIQDIPHWRLSFIISLSNINQNDNDDNEKKTMPRGKSKFFSIFSYYFIVISSFFFFLKNPGEEKEITHIPQSRMK